MKLNALTPGDRPPFLVRSSAEQLVNVAGIVNGTLTTIYSGDSSSLLSSPLLISHDLPFLLQSLWPPSPRIVLTIEFPQSRPRFAVPYPERLLTNRFPLTTLLSATTARTRTRTTTGDSQPNTPLPLTPRAPPRLTRLSVMSIIIPPGTRQVTKTLLSLPSLSLGNHRCLPSRTSSAELQNARAA